jgi:hypothetical protein
MNEQITSAAELDALPVGSVIRAEEKHGTTVAEKNGHRLWEVVGLPLVLSVALKSEHLAVNSPFTVLYRPDQPQRVQPSREDVADGLIQARSSGMCRFGKVCDLCDCGLEGHTDDEARRADSRTLIEADAVLALFAQQPTVAEVKAEAWDEGWIAASAYRAAGKVQDGYFVGAYAQPLNPYRADRIEREARP